MADNRQKILESLIKSQERYQTLLSMQEKSGNDYSAALEKQNERVKKLGSQLKELNKSNQQFVGQMENGISSISSSFSSFKNTQNQVVLNAKSLTNISSYQKELVESMLSDSRDLANLNSSDTQQILAKVQSLESQLDVAKSIFGIDSDIVASLQAQKEEALNIAKLSEDERRALEMQHAAAEKLKESMQAISESVQTALMRLMSVRGVMGGLMVSAGKVLKNFSEVNKELGKVGDYTDGAAFNASLMSFAFSDAAGTLKALSAEMGGTEDATFGAQLQTNLMANNLGISNVEAAQLSGSLARLNGSSLETAGNLSDAARNLARANNIPVSQMMGDLAGSAEEFALFGKQGGDNILQAAGYAAKLGTNMGTLSKISEGLLDFETSITKELELGAILGKNINLNKARQLAYDGDIEGATKATLDQLGGIDAFNKMDYYQKKQTADLLGVSVAELQKMATNQEKAAAMSKTFSGTWSNLTEGIKAAASEYGPKMLDWSGKFLMLSSQAGTTWSTMGGGIKKVAGKVGGLFSKGAKAGAAAASSIPSVDTGSVSDKLNKTTGGKGMNVMNMVKGAAAILILSAALFVAAKAFQEFGSVTWEAVGMGLVGLAGMAAIAMVLGKVTGQIIQGSIAVALLGLALIPFAYSMKMMADIGIGQFLTIAGGLIILSAAAAILGFALPFIASGALALGLLGAGLVVFGAGMMVAGKGLEMFVGSISTISQIIPQLMGMGGFLLPLGIMIAGLASVFMLLGASLAFLGTAGLPGLAVLAGIAAVGGMIITIADYLGFGGDEGGSGETTAVENGSLSEYQSQMLQKMDLLIQTTASARDVYLDKDKVTNIIMDKSERVTKNTFGLGAA